MKYLVTFLVICTSYNVCAKVGEIKLNLNKLNFGNPKDTQVANIYGDLQELLHMLPLEKIQTIVKKWIQNDREVRNNWRYITSDHYRKLLAAVEHSDEFLAVQEKLASVNLDLPFFTRQMHDALLHFRHMTHNEFPTNVPPKRVNGLRGMLEEIRPEIPMSKIIFKGANKFVNNLKFREFVTMVRNRDFKEQVNQLGHSMQVRNLIEDMKANGIDIQAIRDFIYSLSPLLEQSVRSVLMQR